MDALILAAMALLAAALPVSIAGANIALGLLTLALLLRRWQGPPAPGARPWWSGRVAQSLILYGAVGVLVSVSGYSLANSAHDWHKDLHKIWACALLLTALPTLVGREDDRLPRLLALGFCAAAAIGIGQTVWHLARTQEFYRAHAFVHPVAFGDMMGLGALGGLAPLFSAPDGVRRQERPYLAALLALALPALLLSGTRGAAAGLGVGAFALAFPERASWTLDRSRMTKLLIVSALAAAAALTAVVLRRESLAGSAADSSIGGHRMLWIVGLKIFRDHPLLGVGPGNYRLLFPQYCTRAVEGAVDWASAHNMYIEALAERGIAGFSALILVLGALLASARRAFLERRSAASLWAFAAVAGFLVMNITETAFQNEQTTTLLLFIWALGQTA